MAVADILLTPVKIYTAPVGEALPNIDTKFYGVAWGGNWVDIGFTLEKLTMSRKVTDYELDIEQTTLPVKRIMTKEDVMLETVIGEQTGVNMVLVLNGTLTTVAAGVNIRASQTVVAGGNPQMPTYAVGFEGFYLGASNVKLPVRLFLYIATITLNGGLEFTKSKAAGLPIQFKALADTTLAVGAQVMKWQKVTAKGTTDAEV